ncbi:MAG: hypothetical protein ACYC5O_18430 [Anaerolineae bacterium]
MRTGRSRRGVLTGLLTAGLGACGGARGAPAAAAVRAWAAPVPADGGLLLFLLPGLSATDLLLAASAGEAPNAEAMRRRGLLADRIETESGRIYSEEELGQELLASWSRDAVLAPCLAWRRPPASTAGPDTCAENLAERWRGLAGSALAAADAGARTVLIADSGLLSLQETTLIADERQGGYSLALAGASALLVRQAVKAVDAALALLLRRLDLSAWTVALLSDGEAWPVHTALDPAEAGMTAPRLYDGGAVMETATAVALPESEAWAGTLVGVGPAGGSNTRLLAPAGYVFAAAGSPLPRATVRAGGFLLATGGGLAGGVRLSTLTPARLALYLAHLADHEPKAVT